MNDCNPYSSGEYYKEVYSPIKMKLEESSRWMMNYFNVVKKLFPDVYKFKNKKLIEFGSGFGGFINILNNQGFLNVTASDMSREIFSKELKNEHLILDLLLDNSGFGKTSYDLAFAFDVMEHINDTEKVVSNIFNMLNHDGIFIFSAPFPLKKHLMDKYHTNMQYPNFYINVFKQNGFELIKMQDISFIPFLWRIRLPLFVKFVVENKFFISETFFIFKRC